MQRRILRTMAVFWLAAMGISLAAPNLPGAEPGGDAGVELVQGFRQPPDQTKPWVYWYWITDNISQEGITRDLEAMARVGIGEAFIGSRRSPNRGGAWSSMRFAKAAAWA